MGAFRRCLGGAFPMVIAVAALISCGHGATPSGAGASQLPTFEQPGVGNSPGAAKTPAPVLAGPTVRVLPAGVGGQFNVIATNADPGTKATFGLGVQRSYRTLAAETDAHLRREVSERALLADEPIPSARYHLQATSFAVGATQPFWVLLDTDATTGREKQVTATLMAVGQRCYVWVDPNSAGTDAERATLQRRVQEIANTFDSSIYPTDTRLFGSEPNPGIDGDPRIHILISPAVNDSGANSTLGYFSRRDEYPQSSQGSKALQYSNQKELINVAASVVLTGSQEDYLGTIAHEFQHMINFNQKVLLGGHSTGEDLWIDEGMAMYALEACGYGLRNGGKVLLGHVQAFQNQPDAYSLNDWANNPQGIGYGAVYLFTVYVADRFGEGILHEIVTTKDVGFNNLEARLVAHGSHFTDTFSDWAAANVLDKLPGASAPRFSYTTLDMHGTYDGVTLAGFQTTALQGTGSVDLALRPCNQVYTTVDSLDALSSLLVPSGVTLLPRLGP